MGIQQVCSETQWRSQVANSFLFLTGGTLTGSLNFLSPDNVSAADFGVSILRHDAGFGVALTTTPSTGNSKLATTGAGATLMISAANYGFGTATFGTTAAGVLAIANGTAPTTSPAGLGQLYVLAGALVYRGASGTVTTVAAS